MSAEEPRIDSSQVEFWDSRYRNACTPWDFGGVPEEFAAWVRKQPGAQRTLIPGCGSAHEVATLAQLGWPVEAIDYSPSAVARAQEALGPHARHVREADFFAFEPGEPFMAVYERAFLCALPPRMRPAYAERMAQIVAPEGVLAGFFFVAEEAQRGPPFPIPRERLNELLDPHFEQREDLATANPLGVFGVAERWQVWRRRTSD